MRGIAVGSAIATGLIWLLPPRHLAVPTPDPEVLRRAVTVGVAIGLTALAVTSHLPTAAVAGTIAALLPVIAAHRQDRRAHDDTVARWPDFLTALRSRLATGASLPAATAAAGRHVGGRFAELETPPGTGFSEHLRDTRSRWQDPIADRALMTLDISARVGGAQVGEVIGALSHSIADELRLQRSHEAALTQQRLTARVALVAPWAILLVSLLTNPMAHEAYTGTTGRAIILGGLAATLLGYALARRTARLTTAPRLFS